MTRLSLKNKPRVARRVAGFTLFEMLLAVALLGFISLWLSPSFRSLLTARDLAYKERQGYINAALGQALLDYAEAPPDTTAGAPDPNPDTALPSTGRLPLAYTNSATKHFLAPVDVTTPTRFRSLRPFALARGVPANELNDDGRAGARVRVYQLAQGVAAQAALQFDGSPQVTLTYDMGVVYTTACERASTTCNKNGPGPTTQVPAPAKLTRTNYATWAPPSDAVGVTYVSTLATQKKMLAATSERLSDLRDRMLRFYQAKGQFPRPSTAPALVATGPQCHDGWYYLSAVQIIGAQPYPNDILAQVGVPSLDMGRTAWGARIEYCADFVPNMSKPKGQAPTYAALRILKNVTDGVTLENEQGPDYLNDMQNYTVISF